MIGDHYYVVRFKENLCRKLPVNDPGEHRRHGMNIQAGQGGATTEFDGALGAGLPEPAGTLSHTALLAIGGDFH